MRQSAGWHWAPAFQCLSLLYTTCSVEIAVTPVNLSIRGRAASGWALAPEPPRAIGVGPEFPHILARPFPPYFFHRFWDRTSPQSEIGQWSPSFRVSPPSRAPRPTCLWLSAETAHGCSLSYRGRFEATTLYTTCSVEIAVTPVNPSMR